MAISNCFWIWNDRPIRITRLPARRFVTSRSRAETKAARQVVAAVPAPLVPRGTGRSWRWWSRAPAPDGRCRLPARRSGGRRSASMEARSASGTLPLHRAKVLATTLFAYLILRFGIRLGQFVPSTYLQQVAENSDFRKYADGLRMVIDCSPHLAETIERRLKAAAGVAFSGTHRQEAAMRPASPNRRRASTTFISSTARKTATPPQRRCSRRQRRRARRASD
jgi:hypothetical protein